MIENVAPTMWPRRWGTDSYYPIQKYQVRCQNLLGSGCGHCRALCWLSAFSLSLRELLAWVHCSAAGMNSHQTASGSDSLSGAGAVLVRAVRPWAAPASRSSDKKVVCLYTLQIQFLYASLLKHQEEQTRVALLEQQVRTGVASTFILTR